jgi:hypothetical protein
MSRPARIAIPGLDDHVTERAKVWSSGFDDLNRPVAETAPGPNVVTLTRKGEVRQCKDPRSLAAA